MSMKPRNRGPDFMTDAMNKGNEVAIDQLEEKTSFLLNMTKGLNTDLTTSNAKMKGYLDNASNGNDSMLIGRNSVKSILDDPSGIGILKIAMVVFILLCVLYFGGKLIQTLFFK